MVSVPVDVYSAQCMEVPHDHVFGSDDDLFLGLQTVGSLLDLLEDLFLGLEDACPSLCLLVHRALEYSISHQYTGEPGSFLGTKRTTGAAKGTPSQDGGDSLS